MPYVPDPDLASYIDARLAEQARAVRNLIDARLKVSTDLGDRLAALAALVEHLVSNTDSAASLREQLHSLHAEVTSLRAEMNRNLEAATRAITKRQVARLMREESSNG